MKNRGLTIIVWTILSLAAVLTILSDTGSAWYRDCNITATKNIGYGIAGLNDPAAEGDSCALNVIRVKTEGLTVVGVDVLKGNFHDALRASDREVSEKVTVERQ